MEMNDLNDNIDCVGGIDKGRDKLALEFARSIRLSEDPEWCRFVRTYGPAMGARLYEEEMEAKN